ncbi:MAG: hypothetical protein ACI4F3_03470 [Enterocloster sp.]
MHKPDIYCCLGGEEQQLSTCRMEQRETDAFICLMKAGIYKELHRRKLLTDTQLNELLNNIPDLSDPSRRRYYGR